MGIRFYCPNGHKLNVKAFQAGRKGICPYCGSKIHIPLQSTRRSGKQPEAVGHAATAARPAATQAARFSSAPTDGYHPASVEPPVETVSPAEQGPERSVPVRTSFSSPVEPVEPSHAVIPPQSDPVTPVEATASPASLPPTTAPGTAATPTAPAQSDSSVLAAAPAGSRSASGPSSVVPRDPLREGGDVVWYVRPPTGGQFGPASPDVMRTWIDQGRVSPDSLVWREGWRDWQGAGELFPQLGAGQETSPFGQLLPGVGGQGAGPAATPTAGERARSRRQSQTIQMVTVTVLIIAVAILLAVFLWVLQTP